MRRFASASTSCLEFRRKRTDHFASTDPEFLEGAAGPELAEGKKGGIEFTPGLNHRFSQSLLEKCFTFIFRKIAFAWSRYAIRLSLMQEPREVLGLKKKSRHRKTIPPRVADSYFRLASCKGARKTKVADWRTRKAHRSV
jgi:hypothetical protein